MKFLRKLAGAILMIAGLALVIYGAFVWGFFDLLKDWWEQAVSYVQSILSRPEIASVTDAGWAILIIALGLLLIYVGDKLTRN